VNKSRLEDDVNDFKRNLNEVDLNIKRNIAKIDKIHNSIDIMNKFMACIDLGVVTLENK
jgi:hypothetical protein